MHSNYGVQAMKDALTIAGIFLFTIVAGLASLVLMFCIWIGYILIFIGLPIFIIVWAIKEFL